LIDNALAATVKNKGQRIIELSLVRLMCSLRQILHFKVCAFQTNQGFEIFLRNWTYLYFEKALKGELGELQFYFRKMPCINKNVLWSRFFLIRLDCREICWKCPKWIY